jgi:hypothetical protein
MVQSRGRLRLALEAAERLLVLGDIIGQELEGDKTAQLEVCGLADDSHATTADFFENAIVGNRWAISRGGRFISGTRRSELKGESVKRCKQILHHTGAQRNTG